MAPEHIPKTSFSTSWGKWEYLQMPFGIKNRPSHFQRCMQAILGDLDFSDVYINNVILYYNGFDEHLVHLHIILQLLRNKNLKAAPKISLFQREMEFLGHKIRCGNTSPQEAKIQAIATYPTPTTKKAVRTFLGVTGFYRKFIPNYSTIANPLFAMTAKQDQERPSWTAESDRAFCSLMQALTSSNLLRAPDESTPFVLSTDTSTVGVGAVWHNWMTTGKKNPLPISRKSSSHTS